jgi:uncharacterized protein (TIGR03790 family)
VKFASTLSAVVSCIIAAAVHPCIAAAEVRPEQVAVVVNLRSHQSIEVAEHYVTARNVPRKQILKVELPLEDTIDRPTYEQQLVAPIRAQLEQSGLAQTVRVLVTTYGVPLRVGAPETTEQDNQFVLNARAKRDLARASLEQIVQQARNLPTPGAGVGKTEDKATGSLTDQELIMRTKEALESAAQRIKGLTDAEQQKAAAQKLSGFVMPFGGLMSVASDFKQLSPAEAKRRASTIEAIEKEIQGAHNLLRAMEQLGAYENQERTFAIVYRIYGSVGVLTQAAKEIEFKRYREADASVDSELSMLWWDRELYPLAGRLPNPLYRGISSGVGALKVLPVLMVSRIDGPNVESSLKMIDQALDAEKNGLKGKAYVDARGLKPTKPGDPLALWDQKLLDFGWMLRHSTSYSVYIDRFEPLIEKAPETALYVGWYSLRNYQDAFAFAPGAIGYHIASEEAVSIHNEEEKGWCRNMLLRGVTVTLGAVSEPYVDSFPSPQEFFGFLLSGRYSLVEAYYLSSPYVSWRMVLFGDPLYSPWRGQNLIEMNALGIKLGNKELGEFPKPPAELEMTDPLTTLRKIKENRTALSAQINSYFNALQNQKPVLTPSQSRPKRKLMLTVPPS